MSIEPWRVKQFYDKRILIEVSRVLESSVSDSLICLTGAQLEMLRNLCQYLHRRSTFVDEYLATGYLAPTNEEWDEIQAIVAELEEALMGCTEITEQLEAIAGAVACLCEQARYGSQYTSLTQPMIEYYLDNGELQYDDPYPQEEVEDPVRCATAQLAWQQSWELLTEYIQPTQAKTIDILLPAAMVALATWVGTPLLGIPTGIILALLWDVIEVWVEGQLQSVANQLFSAKEELICAVYVGLEGSLQDAHDAAAEEINSWEGFSEIDKIVMRALYAPWLIALAAKAWENQSQWAIDNVTPGYCLLCEQSDSGHYEFPPCPGDFTGTAVCNEDSRLSMDEPMEGLGPIHHIEPGAYDVRLQVEFQSDRPASYTVGYVTFRHADSPDGPFTDAVNFNIDTDLPTHQVCHSDETIPDITLKEYVRLAFNAQSGSTPPTPYRFEVIQVDWSIES
jgi:hypothetical protein